jgi:hypothetical protein
MEILGRTIPNLQNAIASGLESVTAGIAESTKASGVAALSIAQDSFSFEQIGTAGSEDLPSVSETAEYPDPNQYFGQFSEIASNSPVSSLAISKTLSDPNFNAPKSLQIFSNSSGSMVDNLLQTFRKSSGSVADDLVKLVNAFVIHNLSPGAEHKESLAFPERDGELKDKMLQMNPDPTYSAQDRLGRDQRDGSSLEGAAVSGSSDAASNRSIIVVGGKSDDRSIIVVGGKSDERSIIVVGGKTSGTYFQTIDDSWNQLQKNPNHETANLFSNQLGVVRDLTSTVNQTVQFQQNLASNLFKGLRG